jgi:hypothetical protein
LDSETQTLVESLRSGANQLAGDLAAVETNMGSLYDAAAGRVGGSEGVVPDASPNGAAHASVADLTIERGTEPQAVSNTESQPEPQAIELALANESLLVPHTESKPSAVDGDLDGARLVALNMALNGDSREETGRYLAENFDVPDRERLLDEVYAAIEG